jgi:hypothetical protein
VYVQAARDAVAPKKEKADDVVLDQEELDPTVRLPLTTESALRSRRAPGGRPAPTANLPRTH